MQPHEIDAYLGDFADKLDADQKTELSRIADDLADRYEDSGEAQAAAFAAAAAYMLGDTNTDAAARTYQAAQQARDEALAAAIQVAEMSGLSNVAAAKKIGITPRTVRRHLGKEKTA